MSAQHAIVWTPEQAERLAKFAHLGQTDKNGEDYWAAHLYDVVQRLQFGLTGRSISSPRFRALSPEDADLALMIAWLHDTHEDTPLSMNVLMDLGAPFLLWNGVYKMTRPSQRTEWKHMSERTREQAKALYHEEIRDNPVLLAVKEADIASNTAPNRVYSLRLRDPKTADRLAAKYAADREALGLEDPWT